MKKSIQDVDLSGKRVFVRVDYNVPLNGEEITDDTRIRQTLPTIEYLLSRKAKVILGSHLGRPKGKVVSEFRMAPVQKKLEALLGTQVKYIPDVMPDQIQHDVEALEPGEVFLLENLRFHPGEEANDSTLSRSLADLADAYVNDAFGTSHRAHASTCGMIEHISGPCVAGFLLEKELKFLKELIEHPNRPFVAVIGGAKISDKIGVIERLIDTSDSVLIGGGMANTFLAAQGHEMGNSLVEKDALDKAGDILKKAESKGITLYLPTDLVVARELKEQAPSRRVSIEGIEPSEMALDIGQDTIATYQEQIRSAATVILNGPMGVFEVPPFDQGTVAICQAMAENTGDTVVGGGDSVAAIKHAGVEEAMTHISTGGGASLKLLEGKSLPGVEALENK